MHAIMPCKRFMCTGQPAAFSIRREAFSETHSELHASVMSREFAESDFPAVWSQATATGMCGRHPETPQQSADGRVQDLREQRCCQHEPDCILRPDDLRHSWHIGADFRPHGRIVCIFRIIVSQGFQGATQLSPPGFPSRDRRGSGAAFPRTGICETPRKTPQMMHAYIFSNLCDRHNRCGIPDIEPGASPCLRWT